MHLSPLYGAKTRAGAPCRGPGMRNGRCRLHGGASPEAPRGKEMACTATALLGRGN
ncbi:HGGxSTG domain-containing protein [Methylobacterium nodulans]|uniref:HGGxSTG domain-containing protein n=1 Tax=Methylobacterium nodulans TaxID=114616 RepID=UPI003CC76EC2